MSEAFTLPRSVCFSKRAGPHIYAAFGVEFDFSIWNDLPSNLHSCLYHLERSTHWLCSGVAATDTPKNVLYFEGGMKNQAIKSFCLELWTFEIISFHKALFQPVYHLTIIVLFSTLVTVGEDIFFRVSYSVLASLLGFLLFTIKDPYENIFTSRAGAWSNGG